jgi:hypothetical protein
MALGDYLLVSATLDGAQGRKKYHVIELDIAFFLD